MSVQPLTRAVHHRLGLFALLAADVYLAGPQERRRPAAERRTVGAVQRTAGFPGIVTLEPPPDGSSDRSLLLAHTAQHMLLLLPDPAPILIGTPGWMPEPMTGNRVTNAIGFWLTRPIVAHVISATCRRCTMPPSPTTGFTSSSTHRFARCRVRCGGPPSGRCRSGSAFRRCGNAPASPR